MPQSRANLGLLLALLAAILATACGGGSGTTSEFGQASGTPAAPSVSPSITPPVIQPTPAAVPPTLTVRASSSMAANVGPIMQVRIDGTAIGSVEVRSSDLSSYSFDAPTLHAGSRVDIVFNNDAIINGEDRNLYVA